MDIYKNYPQYDELRKSVKTIIKDNCLASVLIISRHALRAFPFIADNKKFNFSEAPDTHALAIWEVLWISWRVYGDEARKVREYSEGDSSGTNYAASYKTCSRASNQETYCAADAADAAWVSMRNALSILSLINKRSSTPPENIKVLDRCINDDEARIIRNFDDVVKNLSNLYGEQFQKNIIDQLRIDINNLNNSTNLQYLSLWSDKKEPHSFTSACRSLRDVLKSKNWSMICEDYKNILDGKGKLVLDQSWDKYKKSRKILLNT